MGASGPNIDDLRDEFEFTKGLYNSLEDVEDAQEEKDALAQKLESLVSQMENMQPPPKPLAQWGESDESATQRGSAASASSDNSFTSANQSFVQNPKALDLPSRKRLRTVDDYDLPAAKSHRSTPQPPDTSRYAVEDFDFFGDDQLMAMLGEDWQDDQRRNKEYLEELESKRRQEEEDAAFARQLQEKWFQDFDLQPTAKSNAPTTSFNQSYMKPDGSWQKPSSQPAASGVKPELKSGQLHSGVLTPISDSSSGIEEISADDWMGEFTRIAKMNIKSARGNSALQNSFSMMPGAFPAQPYNPYASAPGLSVYGGLYVPPTSNGVSRNHSYLGTGFNDMTDIGEVMARPGSSTLPFDLTSLGTPPYLPGFGGYADPDNTREEIKDLLKHIRPDEELTEEQLREVQPDGLQINLMAHQRKGFAWMKSMEEGTNKGGILADDMGLGKTVQAISLILARPPDPGAQSPTLIVAPVALMQQWEREIKKFVRPSHKLQVLILHQENRNKSWAFIRRFDVVLTTFGTLGSELKRKLFWAKHLETNPDAKPKPQQECPVLGDASKFHRVILDEAQNIKNRNTKAALAACQIKADYRWCLSGTPMQNNVDEIYSLIKFCRIRPYHDYEKFARDIGRPLRRTSEYSKEKAMKQLQAILKATLLRRTKESKIDGQPIIRLPPKHVVQDRAVFSSDELDFYKNLERQAQIQFNRFLKQGSVGRYYSHALVLLLRLRQCCCSPQLVTNAKEFMTSGPLTEIDHIENAKQLSKDVVRRLDANDAYECPICMDAVENPIIFVPCGHTLCNECLQAMVDKSLTDAQSRLNCPHCRADIDINKVTDLESYLRVYHPDRPGVKPVEELAEHESESDSDSDTSDSEEDEKEAISDNDSLRDFVVPDDQEEEDVKSDDDDNLDEKKTLLEVLRDEQVKAKHKVKVTMKKSPKDKSEKRSSRKGKGKAKEKIVSLADLRKEGLKSKAAKKRYLKRLEKGFEMSAKIQRTLDLLHEIKDRGQDEKTIVFSSFTSFLDLVEVPLYRDEQLSNYARYDGSMKASDRNDAVIRFSDDPLCKIMLISLKAGNAGLNLTAANHVIILDPFWNPFVEHQAADRCYRIGQTREVTIHRILIGENEDADADEDEERDFTVEDRILRLQQKKQKLVDTALDEKAATSLGRLTARDLGFLFGVNSMD